VNLQLDGPVLKSFGIGKFSSSDQDFSKIVTAFNLVGTIPLVGIISGIFRFAIAKTILNDPDTNSDGRTGAKVLIVRGILECLGVGILLTPVDIGCSLARLVRDHRKASLERDVHGYGT
jgi:hypothetical protein